MNPSAAVMSSINFLGFAGGTILYALLLAMVVRHPIRAEEKRADTKKWKFTPDWFLLATAILGLLWNIGNLTEIAWRDYFSGQPSPIITAIAFTALGFLPALIVHSEWAAHEYDPEPRAKLLTLAAYLLSGGAGLLHFRAFVVFNASSSTIALQILTVGYLAILVALFLTKRQRRDVTRKNVLMAALAFFAISALHLSQPHTESRHISVEILGHHASLPLAFVVLYQDFRFAFADIFLKRALSLSFLFAFVLSSYLLLVTPILAIHDRHPQPDTQGIAVLIIFGMAGALVYPKLNQFAVWIVDRILLRRLSYGQLQTEIMKQISDLESVEAVLDEVKVRLAGALTAKAADFEEVSVDFENLRVHMSLINIKLHEAKITIPTVDEPQYEIILRDFAGGRRLLSNEIEMLESVALYAARRIDALRVLHERCERELREEEFSKLATEAELRVLRAQINPHFLFNALTTIGYLIQTAPERAVETLIKLTRLLRETLRSTGEFQTLGDELKLIKVYLEIEQARFEERLKVEIDIDDEFLSFRIPSLILQPLVENAVKHGISPIKNGGTVSIAAYCENDSFVLEVADTGSGIELEKLLLKRESRVGLNNVEQRLKLYSNGAASLEINPRADGGTIVRIHFDLNGMPALKSFQTLSVPAGKQTEHAVS